MTILKELDEQVKANPILLYMKGSPDAPQCGFSSKASQILIACGKPFSFVDILSNPEIRANLPCLLYTFPSPRDQRGSRMPSCA